MRKVLFIAARDLFGEATRFGVTSIQTMAIGNRGEVSALLRRAGSPIRFRVIDFALTGPAIPWKPPASRVAGNITISGLKWIIDGTPVERSCAMREPYTDEPRTRGEEYFSQAEMQAMLQESRETGEQLLVHIAGDRGIEDFIKAMMATGGPDGPLNPYLNIMFASANPFRPGESLTREQAVVAYTLQSAYAEFAEKDKGSLEPGKLADVVVLSPNIFQVPLGSLPQTESVLTMIGGKIVYDRLKR